MANRVILRDVNEPGDTRHLEARYNETGDLVIEGQDIGETVERLLGGREYEWVWTIRAADFPRLIAALDDGSHVLDALERRFAGDRAHELKGFLDEHGVVYEAWSRVGE